MRVVKKTQNQENYKRGNVSRLNILFVFLFFFSTEKKSLKSSNLIFFLFRGDKRSLKKKVEERKI